jgi:hypothetical protein
MLTAYRLGAVAAAGAHLLLRLMNRSRVGFVGSASYYVILGLVLPRVVLARMVKTQNGLDFLRGWEATFIYMAALDFLTRPTVGTAATPDVSTRSVWFVVLLALGLSAATKRDKLIPELPSRSDDLPKRISVDGVVTGSIRRSLSRRQAQVLAASI